MKIDRPASASPSPQLTGRSKHSKFLGGWRSPISPQDRGDFQQEDGRAGLRRAREIIGKEGRTAPHRQEGQFAEERKDVLSILARWPCRNPLLAFLTCWSST